MAFRLNLRDPKQRRVALLVLAAAAALFVLMRHRASSQQTTATTAATPGPDPTVTASGYDSGGGASYAPTVADNGAQAAALGDQITSSLGGVSDALAGVAASQDQLSATVAALQGNTDTQAATPAAVTVNVAAPAAPSGRAKGSPSGKPPPKTTSAGYHAGHSAGHQFYLPGHGWVSKSKYEAATKKAKKR